MLHTKFRKIGPLVPEKILKVFTIYGHGGVDNLQTFVPPSR